MSGARSDSAAPSRKSPSSARWSVVTAWMGDRYVLGFAPTSGFLRGQIRCRLYKSPTDEAITRAYTRAKRSRTHATDPVVHVRGRWTMDTPK